MAQQLGVADLLVRCLEREGITVVFGIPGEENIGFTDALARSPIRYVLVRHEQAASFMAEIYGRLTGRAGVCSATLGPGAINLLLGAADATTNSSPVVALSAQVGLNRIYKESHQSVNLVSMFSPVTKWADVMLTPGAVPEMVRKAFKLAQTERPGAVYLAVPEDVEAMGVPEGLAPLNINIPRPDEPSASQIERAAAVLGGARQPVVLAGHGAARAGAAGALRRFSEQLGLPMATTSQQTGVIAKVPGILLPDTDISVRAAPREGAWRFRVRIQHVTCRTALVFFIVSFSMPIACVGRRTRSTFDLRRRVRSHPGRQRP